MGEKQMEARELEEMTLEEAFEKVEAILSDMEDGSITLEGAFQNYRQGMELLKACSEKLDAVEKKMKIMDEEGEISEFQ